MACYDNASSMRHIYGTLSDNAGQPVLFKLLPDIKVKKAAKLYMYSLRDPKVCPQTKFGIPMSNHIGFMLVTRDTPWSKMHQHANFGIPTLNYIEIYSGYVLILKPRTLRTDSLITICLPLGA